MKKVKLKDDLGFEDETEVYYDYENVTNFVQNKNSAYALFFVIYCQ